MKIIDSEFLKSKIFSNQKVVFLVGAGISVNAGIPDFRSSSGIFADIKKSGIKGVDLFTYRDSLTQPTRKIYLETIQKMRLLMESSQPTLTHKMMKNLKTIKTRVYTQNIDTLEEKAGLKYTKNCQTQLVYLHGNLNLVSCIFCGYKMKLTINFYENGEVTCPSCIEQNKKREKNKLRTLNPGIMHPYIVHYQQSHPESHLISKISNSDRDATLLIVIGTSLKIYGVKMLIKYFNKICKSNNGYSIFVNRSKPNKEFQEVFDFMWEGDCDLFSEFMLKFHGKTKFIESYFKIKDDNKKYVDNRIGCVNKEDREIKIDKEIMNINKEIKEDNIKIDKEIMNSNIEIKESNIKIDKEIKESNIKIDNKDNNKEIKEDNKNKSKEDNIKIDNKDNNKEIKEDNKNKSKEDNIKIDNKDNNKEIKEDNKNIKINKYDRKENITNTIMEYNKKEIKIDEKQKSKTVMKINIKNAVKKDSIPNNKKASINDIMNFIKKIGQENEEKNFEESKKDDEIEKMSNKNEEKNVEEFKKDDEIEKMSNKNEEKNVEESKKDNEIEKMKIENKIKRKGRGLRKYLDVIE